MLPQSTKCDRRLFLQLCLFGSLIELGIGKLPWKVGCSLQHVARLRHCFSKAGTGIVGSGQYMSPIASRATLSLKPARQRHCFSKAGTLAGTVSFGHLTDASRATLSLRQAGRSRHEAGEGGYCRSKAGEPTLTAGVSSPLLLRVSTCCPPPNRSPIF